MTTPEFSKREKEVIEYLLEGNSNKQIAQKMGVSVRTVEFHLSKIYPRLDVHSRTEAVIKLTQESLEGTAGKITSGVLGKSTVARQGERAENEANQSQRRFPMKEILAIVIVFVSSVLNIHRDTSVIVGTATPGPISYKMKGTLPPTPTPLGMEDTPPPTPTPFRMEDTPAPTPTQGSVPPIIMCTPPPCPGNNFACGNPNGCPGGCGTICLGPTPFRMENTPPPTPTRGGVAPIIMCTPPPCPGNNFICSDPNGCPGGCGVACFGPTPTPLGMGDTPPPTPTPLPVEGTPTPLPLLPLERGETPTPIP